MRIIRRYRSAHSGWLEILEEDGERVLDTEKANYSYGLLQEILEAGIRTAGLEDVKNILLLGLGGGSLIHSLRSRFMFRGPITAVEIDPVMIQVALEEFGLSTDRKLKVVEDDAEHFMEVHATRYGLIVVDLFIHTEVPPAFTDFPFWNNLHRVLLPGGKIIFNAAVGRGSSRRLLVLKEMMSDHFRFQTLEGVGGANTLLIASRR